MNSFRYQHIFLSVHRMSNVINDLNLQGCEKCSDHSVLVYELDICHTDEVISEQNPTSPKRFHLNEIPGSFLNCEESLPKIMLTIDNIEKSLAEDSDVSTAYQEFVSLIKSEMSIKLKPKKLFAPNLTSREISHSGTMNSSLSGMKSVILKRIG